MVWQRWLPDKTPTFAKAILAGSAAAAGGTLLRFALQPALGSDLPFVTFFPLLLAAATWGGMRAGVICLALSCAASMTFFLPDTDLLNPAWSVLAFLVSGGLLTLAGSALGSTVLELRENQRRMMVAESDLRTLVSELTHRSRNGLTVIIAIVNQSARKAETARELAEVVNGRLGAMAEAQDEVVRGGGNSAPLSRLLERTLSPFDLERFIFEPSPGLEIAPETAAALALLTHELATNAVKYGALSSPTGQVGVGWKAEPGTVRLVWRERGGPSAAEPRTEGFGTRLLNSVLVSQGGRAQRRFESDGVVCEIDFPHVGQISHVRS